MPASCFTNSGTELRARFHHSFGRKYAHRLAVCRARNFQALAGFDFAVENGPGLDAARHDAHAEIARNRAVLAKRAAAACGTAGAGRYLPSQRKCAAKDSGSRSRDACAANYTRAPRDGADRSGF